MAFTILAGLVLPTLALAQKPARTKSPFAATVPPREPPPAVDPSTLETGAWLPSLLGCISSIPLPTGWISSVTVPVGGAADCTQSLEGSVYKLHAHPAEMLSSRILFRADDITYDRDTEDLHAKGHVYFHNFVNRESVWCDQLDYHAEKGNEYGTFSGHVVGETYPRLVSKPGILTTSSPFHFEGEWAERDGEKYIVHNGWITDCTLPKPWWRLRGPKFDIIPRDRAKAYDSEFLLDGIPIFYFPWFYRPLKTEARKSGFLLPEPFHNTLRGWGIGMGYFWAINRSYDLIYQTQFFDSGIKSHHLEFQATPKPGTALDIVLFGSANNRLNSSSPSGLTIYGEGRSQLGKGWVASGELNFTTTLLFRQDWSQSYNEAVGSEIHTTGFIDKTWSTYDFDVQLSRDQLFNKVEQILVDPVSGNNYLGKADAVTIRKLPELDLTSRDHSILGNLPLWYSFDASAGLMFRSQPFFDTSGLVNDQFQTSAFTDRVHFAPHLTTAFNLGPVHFVPSIGIEETFYSESQTPFQDHYHVVGTDLVRSSRDFSMDVILPSLERIFEKKTFLGDKLKHVIEPRATYLYVTGVGDDFNRFIRFDDTDIRANTSQLTVSLTNRLYAKRGDTVSEIFSWEIAQQRYFDPTFGGALIPGQRNVFESTAQISGFAFLTDPRSSSPVVSTMRMTPITGLSFQWQTDYDHRLHSIVNSMLSVDYRWKKYWLLSAGNNEVHSNAILTPYANQFRMRAGFGNANNRGWNAAVDAIYDYRQQQLLWATTQVTYNTDCCGLSVQFRRVYRLDRPDENLFAVSFSLANLGAFGTLKKNDRLF